MYSLILRSCSSLSFKSRELESSHFCSASNQLRSGIFSESKSEPIIKHKDLMIAYQVGCQNSISHTLIQFEC